ncbi:MAG: FAD-dependent oxidoreductase [Tabrizicola sp.]|nr:FAD-dependent oxidoreductase [Tabrizicola sp.]
MTDVLILGGGLAGTSAALALADRGISSTIIEARGRLGGRAFTRHLTGDAGPPVEFGGGWGTPTQTRLLALTQRLGIGLTPRAPLQIRAHVRGGARHDHPSAPNETAAHEAAMARWRDDAMAADPAILAMTLSEWFLHRAIPSSAQLEITAWWSISGATDPSLGSVGQLMTAKTAHGFTPKVEELAHTITGGIQGVAEAAARESGATVILSDPAERLTQDVAGVRLTLASGRVLTAKAAIVALPVNALEQVRFEPSLPKPQAHVRRQGHVGRVVKYLIRARGIAPGTLVTGLAQGLRWFWADHLRPDGSTLVVAFALANDAPEPSESQARAAMAEAFPGTEFLSSDWHDWLADPFARGVWVGPRAEDEVLFHPDHWSPFGRIAFAGADIGPGADQGWFEGAIASAESAVTAISKLL